MIKIPGYSALTLSHLKRLTDDTGIIQHSKYAVPDRASGYTTDDNARALIVTVKYYELTKDKDIPELIIKYLSFVNYAQREDGYFHNFMSYDRKFIDEMGSEDCFGRCLWATGYLVGHLDIFNLHLAGKEIFEKALKNIRDLSSPRAKGYSILGLYHFFKRYSKRDDILNYINELAESLVNQYKITKDENWKWFEEYLTYGNAIIPMGLFYAYNSTKNVEFLRVAKESTDFLIKTLIKDSYLDLVGNKGWYYKNGIKSDYDHQPIEAGYMTLLFLTAYNTTLDKRYMELAWTSFDWFFGRNRNGKALYNEETGGCFDGLTPEGVNLNQGAESLLVYFLVYLSMYHQFERKRSEKDLHTSNRV
ncbi:MAG TPA: glycosyltransferase [Dictyoglomaceae bacterium]|nr:glycosyltransferase [Dictyoglomaceae bacterium]HOL40138.1 glycosyltransferase [Dictyoglomaceae bacterium]HPP16513.1 glycosyltransferase [Dictyoglomaceae bacterium]